MLIWMALLVGLAVVAVAVAARLLLRKVARNDTYFSDPAGGASTLVVIGTITGVMLAFVILFALQSYQRAREGAGLEAIKVSELDTTAAVLGGEARSRLHGELVCYARAVVNDEWPAMAEGRSSDWVQAWQTRMSEELTVITPQGAREEAAYGKWMDATAQRRDGRRARLAEANASVPLPLWVVLGTGATFVVMFMALQADRRESKVVEGVSIGFVATMVAAGLLVVWLLDHPYWQWHGSVAPTEMRRTLSSIDYGQPAPLPCDERGEPIGS